MKVFVVLTICLVAVCLAQDAIRQETYFHNVPPRYYPFIDTEALKVTGDCRQGFVVRSKFILAIPNPDKCQMLGFSKPLISGNTLSDDASSTIDFDAPKCVDGAPYCTQTLSAKTVGVGCNPDLDEATLMRQADISLSAAMSGNCNTIARSFGNVGLRVNYMLSDLLLSKASKTSHVENKRDVGASRLRARGATLGQDCMTDADCNCNLECVNATCVALAQNAWRNDSCSTPFDPPGMPPCVTFYCNPNDVYTFDPAVAAQGCGAIYQATGTACSQITEPGAWYGNVTVGVCQGGYEGYCAANNQAQFLISSSSSTTVKTSATDKFHASSSDGGQFNEGGFPLLIGSSMSEPAKRQNGLPLEWEELHTEPWIHADDEDTIVGVNAIYPVNRGLVDDDELDDDDILETIRTGLVNCNLTLLHDENGNPVDFCSGQAAGLATSAPNTVWLNGTYRTPRSGNYLTDDEDNSDGEDDGGDQANARLKKAKGYCSPVCYCDPLVFNNITKYQVVQCTRGYHPTAGDQGDKDTRLVAYLGTLIPMLAPVIVILMWFWIASYSGIARTLSSAIAIGAEASVAL